MDVLNIIHYCIAFECPSVLGGRRKKQEQKVIIELLWPMDDLLTYIHSVICK